MKNFIPKRKYRERAQPENREKHGLLEKKKDYKARAQNYHKKKQQLDDFKMKAQLKNQDEFYFKMLKSKRNEQGKHIDLSESDSDFDEKEFRKVLKTENYSLVKMQKKITQNKIDQLKAKLHMTGMRPEGRTLQIFVNPNQSIEEVDLCKHFQTTQELLDNNLLEVNPKQFENQALEYSSSNGLKQQYTKLVEETGKAQKLEKLLLKIDHEKNLLSKERRAIKKFKGKKITKFFQQRKK